jgi:hypothetical protein
VEKPVSGYNNRMEFFNTDPDLIRYPPAETHLLELRATLNPDGKRLRVILDLTPFQQRPLLELELTDSSGNEVASASIIEPVGWKLELTLHIRRTTPTNENYTLAASLSYPELGEIDRRTVSIIVPTAAD